MKQLVLFAEDKSFTKSTAGLVAILGITVLVGISEFGLADSAFKCTDENGQVEFSDQPCTADAVEIMDMPYVPVMTQDRYPQQGDDTGQQSVDDRQKSSIYTSGNETPESCEMGVSAWELHVQEYQRRLEGCGDKHSGTPFEELERRLEIGRKQQVKRSSGSEYELHRKDLNELGCRVSLRKTHAQHGINFFRKERCIETCAGHAAGYNWAAGNGIKDCYNCFGTPPSASFTEGCMAFVVGR